MTTSGEINAPPADSQSKESTTCNNTTTENVAPHSSENGVSTDTGNKTSNQQRFLEDYNASLPARLLVFLLTDVVDEAISTLVLHTWKSEYLRVRHWARCNPDRVAEVQSLPPAPAMSTVHDGISSSTPRNIAASSSQRPPTPSSGNKNPIRYCGVCCAKAENSGTKLCMDGAHCAGNNFGGSNGETLCAGCGKILPAFGKGGKSGSGVVKSESGELVETAPCNNSTAPTDTPPAPTNKFIASIISTLPEAVRREENDFDWERNGWTDLEDVPKAEPGEDVFGTSKSHALSMQCECPVCNRLVGVSRFSQHLETCLGLRQNKRGRRATRSGGNNASSNGNGGVSYVGMDEESEEESSSRGVKRRRDYED